MVVISATTPSQRSTPIPFGRPTSNPFRGATSGFFGTGGFGGPTQNPFGGRTGGGFFFTTIPAWLFPFRFTLQHTFHI